MEERDDARMIGLQNSEGAALVGVISVESK